jgi:hypothetical protein
LRGTGQIIAKENRQAAYEPLAPAFVNLPNTLAHVRDARGAVRFTRNHGRLGWKETVGRLDQSAHDPHQWVLGEAAAVRWALLILYALQSDSDEELEAVLGECRLAGPLAMPSGGLLHPVRISLVSCDVHAPIERDDDTGAWLGRADIHTWQRSPSELARRLVARQVDHATADFRRRFVSLDASFKCRVENAGALVNAVWYQVGQAALLYELRRCELDTCRLPFVITDQRQRFCPADYSRQTADGRAVPGKSRCAALFQKRRHQRKETP